MIRLAAVVAALAAVASAAAASGVRWSALATGTTLPSGSQSPDGYVAVTRAQSRPWLSRLEPSDRAAVGRLNLAETPAVAVFLDGLPCASKLVVTGVTRSGSTITVRIGYSRPPIGMATCVRTSTAYEVVEVPRAALGSPAASHVLVIVHART